MTELVLRNRQHTRSINSPLLRRLANALLMDGLSLDRWELAIHLMAAPKMALLNQQYLHHKGATDVITFDYMKNAKPAARRFVRLGVDEPGRRDGGPVLHGEIFICIDEAVKQARQFRTTWQSELARYLVHGVLHLVGYDDVTPASRRVMKREENRLLRRLSGQFALRHLALTPPPEARKPRIANRKS